MTNTIGTTDTSRTTPKRPRQLWTAIIVAAAFALGVVVGIAGEPQEPADLAERRAEVEREITANDEQKRALNAKGEELAAQASALEELSAELDAHAKALEKREAKVTKAEEVAEANTVSDGVWTVGVDIKAGTYRATNVSSDCYWMISRTGSNGDIIQNDIPGGGNPQVVLSKGQDFTSSDCGDWVRQ